MGSKSLKNGVFWFAASNYPYLDTSTKTLPFRGAKPWLDTFLGSQSQILWVKVDHRSFCSVRPSLGVERRVRCGFLCFWLEISHIVEMGQYSAHSQKALKSLKRRVILYATILKWLKSLENAVFGLAACQNIGIDTSPASLLPKMTERSQKVFSPLLPTQFALKGTKNYPVAVLITEGSERRVGYWFLCFSMLRFVKRYFGVIAMPSSGQKWQKFCCLLFF